MRLTHWRRLGDDRLGSASLSVGAVCGLIAMPASQPASTCASLTSVRLDRSNSSHAIDVFGRTATEHRAFVLLMRCASSAVALLAALLASSAPYVVGDCVTFPLADASCCAQKAPEKYSVIWKLSVDGGASTAEVVVEVQRAWSPLGADRFYNLQLFHFFDSTGSAADNDAGFFRVVPGFVVQFGIPGNATVGKAWEDATIDNDPVVLSNVRGTISYAAMQDPQGQATGRTTQVFINYADNSRLDGLGFTPFGQLSESSMKLIDRITSRYGEQPDQDAIYQQGDAYLRKSFPGLDYILETRLEAPELPLEPAAPATQLF